MPPSPRAQLRTFLAERFSSNDAFERFVGDHFDDVRPEINWEGSLMVQVESFIGVAVERGFLDKVWPALIEERAAFAEEIRRVQDAWAAAFSGNPVPAAPQAAAPAVAIGRDRIEAIYRAARAAKLGEVRRALLTGLPEHLILAPSVARLDAQLLIDIDHLSRAAGDPPPLLRWLENARLLTEGTPDADVFGDLAEELAKSEVQPAAVAATEASAPAMGLEQIILDYARPAIAVMNGTFADPGREWRELEQHRAVLDRAIAATGRIDSPGDAMTEWSGTGVVVGPGVVATAGHLADAFFDSNGKRRGGSRSLTFDPFREDAGPPDPDAPEVTALLFRHPSWDIAFLSVPRLLPMNVEPLVMATEPPAPADKIVRVTFVGRDPRADLQLQAAVFGDRLNGAKWIMPGLVTDVPPRRATEPRGRATRKEMLGYDTNTLGGTGGPVVSVRSGELLGFGTMRVYLLGNWAVPAWEVIRDRRVRNIGVTVPPSAPPADLPKR